MTPRSSTEAPSRQAEASVFRALADPTRRALFERICEAPRPVGVLARGLPVSRPAVSQHLRVLERAGLVHADRRDTRRIYSARPAGLEMLRGWVERHWDVGLDRFATAAEKAELETRRAKAAAAREQLEVRNDS